MKNARMNQLLLAVLGGGILLTILTNSIVFSARRREADRRQILQTAMTGGAAENETAAGESEPERNIGISAAKATEEIGPGVELSKTGVSSNAGRGKQSSLYDDFRSKFEETEKTLERLNYGNSRNRSATARKNMASSQLRYWETQLGSLYQAIMERLPEEEAAVP